MLRLIFANAAPLNAAMGIHAKMKNLYMSHGFGVAEIRFGIRNRAINTVFRRVPFTFLMNIIVSRKGSPRFAM